MNITAMLLTALSSHTVQPVMLFRTRLLLACRTANYILDSN